MPRTRRWSLPGALYHCIWRFVDRKWFFESDEERNFYLYLLGRSLERSDWRCLAYALMSNHIHLAVVAGERPMASWTQAVNSPFAFWMNRRHGRLGPVFADRAKDYQIHPAHEGSVIAYIHNNPVRAKVVARARDSTWTSHRAYAGLVRAPDWLGVSEGLGRSGFENPARFDAWVDVTPGESGEFRIERMSTTLRRRGALVTGTPLASRGEAHVPVFARPNAHVRPEPGRIVELVAELFAVSRLLVSSRRRTHEAVAARLLAAHCARATGVTTTELADALGVTTQAVCGMTRRAIPSELRKLYDVLLARVATETWGTPETATFDPPPTH